MGLASQRAGSSLMRKRMDRQPSAALTLPVDDAAWSEPPENTLQPLRNHTGAEAGTECRRIYSSGHCRQWDSKMAPTHEFSWWPNPGEPRSLTLTHRQRTTKPSRCAPLDMRPPNGASSAPFRLPCSFGGATPMGTAVSVAVGVSNGTGETFSRHS